MSDTRLQIDFAKEMSKMLNVMRASKSMSEVDRDEVISIYDEFDRYGADDDLLRRTISVRRSIERS